MASDPLWSCPSCVCPPPRLPHFVTQQLASVGQMEDGAVPPSLLRGTERVIMAYWSTNSRHKGMVCLEPRQGFNIRVLRTRQVLTLAKSLEAAKKE